MRKPSEGKTALINFLEAVANDRLAKKGPSKTQQLVDYMTTKKTGHDSSDEVPTKVAVRQAELKMGTPGNPRIDENDDDYEEGQMDEAAFSRQHYQAIADILKNALAGEETGPVVKAIGDITDNLIELFKKDNPRFDADKFSGRVWGEEN